MMQHSYRSSCGSFTLSILLAAAVGCLLGPGSAGAAQAASRHLGTVGPPPRQSPQRQASGESTVPLPLPATPMRRSEPKAQPSGPLFVAKLAYGTTQDYTPNPGDLKSLLHHVRAQLDAWYGHTILNINDLVALDKAGKPCKIPMLYVTGYQSFSFTPEQRAALRNYVLDGGTLLGDATLGSPAFVNSFKQEMAQIFPKRSLENLQLDNPIFRGYYKYNNVHYFTIDNGTHSQFDSPPRMLGINIAARTAVILSPFDMTCGWDEFYAPAAPRVGSAKPTPTLAMMPSDAIRMGINIVAYVAAEHDFAKEQAVTRKIEGTQPQQRAAVKLGLLRHQGDWNPDPNSLYQLIRLLAHKTSIPVSYELQPVDAKIAQLVNTPVLIITGMRDPELSKDAIDALHRHLQAGGFIFINNTSGYAAFDRYARALVKRLLPQHALTPVKADSPLLHTLYDIKQMRTAGTLAPRPVDLEAVTVNGRIVLVYSPNDTLGMLKGIHDPYANAYDATSARELALNVLCYALEQ